MVVVTGAAVVLLVSAAHLATRVAPLVGLRARASGSS
jgi:hypothetical protein